MLDRLTSLEVFVRVAAGGSLSAAGDGGAAKGGGSTLGIEAPAERDRRASRGVVEAEDVAELDLRVPVMTVMVLGED